MWTPDVYEGAPTPVTAFFAAAPKVAGIAMFVRVAVMAFPGITTQWQEIVVFVSIASMLLGSFAAIGQRNIKRLMAYSSIGHMGFALIGLAAGTVGRRAGRARLHGDLRHHDARRLRRDPVDAARRAAWWRSIDQLAGLARTHPAMAFFLAMLLFSMAGMPPLAGFFAKFYVFLAAIKAGLYVLAVIGVLASVVGAYYYLAIIKIMYFDEPAEGFYGMPDELKVVLGVCGAVQHPLLRLSGAAGRRRERGRPFAVLMQLALRGGWRRAIVWRPMTRLASTNAEALALARARRARSALDRGAAADRRPRPARQRMGLAARQPLRDACF